MKKLFKSLQAKYMFIIFTAILFIQSVYLLTALIIVSVDGRFDKNGSEDLLDYDTLEMKWHEDVNHLEEINTTTVNSLFKEWASLYPEAAMYWVDDNGDVASKWNISQEIPTTWSTSYTVSFMKERYDGDPFTIVAFAGENKEHGFLVFVTQPTLERIIVFEIEREHVGPINIVDLYGTWLVVIIIVFLALFILISYMFFRNIRKRLLRLQLAMQSKDADGLPHPIIVKKQDEIGQLEHTFNMMVNELSESKKREQVEEQLRRELVANLSHDLRTPLTKIRAQGYSIRKAIPTTEVIDSVKLMDKSIEQMDTLIENLMAYTLLISDRYQMQLQEVDIIRFLKEHLATWYSAFEKIDLEVDIALDGIKQPKWLVDPIWLGRILDNLYQNIIRHALSGKYVGIRVETRGNLDVISIIDKGPGLESDSQEKGAGIGLSIVDMMIKGQQLKWQCLSSQEGLTIEIYRERQ